MTKGVPLLHKMTSGGKPPMYKNYELTLKIDSNNCNYEI